MFEVCHFSALNYFNECSRHCFLNRREIWADGTREPFFRLVLLAASSSVHHPLRSEFWLPERSYVKPCLLCCVRPFFFFFFLSLSFLLLPPFFLSVSTVQDLFSLLDGLLGVLLGGLQPNLITCSLLPPGVTTDGSLTNCCVLGLYVFLHSSLRDTPLTCFPLPPPLSFP